MKYILILLLTIITFNSYSQDQIFDNSFELTIISYFGTEQLVIESNVLTKQVNIIKNDTVIAKYNSFYETIFDLTFYNSIYTFYKNDCVETEDNLFHVQKILYQLLNGADCEDGLFTFY